MAPQLSPYAFHLASSDSEVAAAQRLRYAVFVEEIGARGGDLTDRVLGLEADHFDPQCEHVLILDTLRENAVVGTTRILDEVGAAKVGGFATEVEFDLSGLRRSGRRLLEVGRTCLHPEHRGGSAMHRLWQGLAGLVEARRLDLLFGLASFPGTDPLALAQPLSCLQQDHLAPDDLRPRSRKPMDLGLLAAGHVCRRQAMVATPALVKAYLRLGGQVGDGAFLDRDFGCIDVCMVLDTATLSTRARRIYAMDPP
ncbi:MAG TPA: GNAT family N-acyltransferase [Rubellimicrobium sp.]|jgi:putative hemolysin|nr:GNAT family N-acyltransferase [Rubellimicrobium sp.]